MSYCRFSDECDVYVVGTCFGESAILDCCGCTLTEKHSFHSRTEMMNHLGEHIKHGDMVPREAIYRLKEEIRLEGDAYGVEGVLAPCQKETVEEEEYEHEKGRKVVLKKIWCERCGNRGIFDDGKICSHLDGYEGLWIIRMSFDGIVSVIDTFNDYGGGEENKFACIDCDGHAVFHPRGNPHDAIEECKVLIENLKANGVYDNKSFDLKETNWLNSLIDEG